LRRSRNAVVSQQRRQLCLGEAGAAETEFAGIKLLGIEPMGSDGSGKAANRCLQRLQFLVHHLHGGDEY
jgi:hypothetical protein